MAQPEVYSFNMGSNIVGTFTETAVGSDKYRLSISGYGYMYDDASTDFTRVGAHNRNYMALLPLCEQQYVEVPSRVKSVAKRCFRDLGKNTDGVDQVLIGEDVEYIDNQAFYCTSYSGNKLKNVALLGDEPKLTSLGSECFYNCDGLIETMFRGYVETIGPYCFDGCYNLESIGLADDYQYSNTYGRAAFRNCWKLSRISNNNTIVSINTELENYTNCKSLQFITIRDPIDEIYDPDSEYLNAYDLYVGINEGVQCDEDGYLYTYLATPFDWYFNEEKVHWRSDIHRHIIQITPFSVYVYDRGSIIELHGYDDGDLPVLHEGQWKYLNVARDSSNRDYSNVHFTHNGRWYQIKY